MNRCDLHLHSRYSNRSEEWLFRRFDFPDSYSDPEELYAQAKTAGWISLRSLTMTQLRDVSTAWNSITPSLVSRLQHIFHKMYANFMSLFGEFLRRSTTRLPACVRTFTSYKSF